VLRKFDDASDDVNEALSAELSGPTAKSDDLDGLADAINMRF